MDSTLTATTAAALPVLLVWAAAVDIFSKAIPNAVVLALGACFALFAVMAGFTPGEIAQHAACALAMLLLGFALFLRSLLGAGDAKLLAVASLWFGPDSLLPFLAATALAGGVLSLVFLAASSARRSLGQETALVSHIPYGAAIATGGLATMPQWLAF